MSSNLPPWNISTGLTIVGFTPPVVTAPRPSTRPSTTISTTSQSPQQGRNDPSLQDHRGGSGTFLRKAAGQRFYNTSKLSLKAIANDPAHAATNLIAYIGAFSDNAREVLERYDLPAHIKRLDASNLLYQVVGRFADLDLRPEVVSNHQMGYVFE